jgi:hypothetical protein
MNGLHDFVAGGYPLPWNVISMAGLSDFVKGGFPLPETPVYFPSSQGYLPKAPPMPKALINLGRHDMIRGFSGMGERSDMIRGFTGVGDCGCGGSCGGCGMGDWTASLPTFLQGSTTLPVVGSVPTVYLAGAAVFAAFLFMGSKRGRR